MHCDSILNNDLWCFDNDKIIQMRYQKTFDKIFYKKILSFTLSRLWTFSFFCFCTLTQGLILARYRYRPMTTGRNMGHYKQKEWDMHQGGGIDVRKKTMLVMEEGGKRAMQTLSSNVDEKKKKETWWWWEGDNDDGRRRQWHSNVNKKCGAGKEKEAEEEKEKKRSKRKVWTVGHL